VETEAWKPAYIDDIAAKANLHVLEDGFFGELVHVNHVMNAIFSKGLEHC
jgi:hypothetical protein